MFCCFQGLHPRIITEGFDKARVKTLEVLENLKIKIEPTRKSLLPVARTSLRTKIHQQLADVLTDVSDTILIVDVTYNKKYLGICFMAFVIR
jgi:T-complex protein 1 subunit zeta